MDHRFLLDELNYINCPGFEFMIYSIWAERYRQVARELKSSGFRFDSMHGPKQTGRLLSETDPESHNQAQKLIRDSIKH